MYLQCSSLFTSPFLSSPDPPYSSVYIETPTPTPTPTHLILAITPTLTKSNPPCFHVRSRPLDLQH